MKIWSNIFWLGTKELRSVMGDVTMIILIVFLFSAQIYSRSTAISESVNNASIAIVDEDHSTLSRNIANAFYPPYFKFAEQISASEVDQVMDQDRFMFVVSIPPRFEADVRDGRLPSVQIDVDATTVTQASLGNSYIQSIITKEVNFFVNRSNATIDYPVVLVQRRAFNPNGTMSWFSSMGALLDNVTLLAIILTGAALLREREHGTIEHLLVMPLTSFQIIMSKVWANGLIVLIAFSLSLFFMVETLLDVPIAGSRWLLLGGTTIYLFSAASIGIFLGTIARTMAQFALLLMIVIIPMMLLSGGITPIESQPAIVQPFTWIFPSRHFMAFSQSVVFRGADFSIVWPELLNIITLGMVFFVSSLALFRRSIAVNK